MKIAAVLTATAATTTAVSGNLLRDSKTAVQKENDRRLTNSERRLAVSGYSGHRLSEDANMHLPLFSTSLPLPVTRNYSSFFSRHKSLTKQILHFILMIS